MPHIVVKLYPGRTQEQKVEMTERIAEAVKDALGASESSISVSIEEVTRERWMEEVYQAEIIAKSAYLYKKPGY